MEQRRLRLGDILDDYCPRERRVTNHAVVAMIDDDVKQTRCTTCDAEHAYKGGREPRRRKKDETAVLYREVLAGMQDADAPSEEAAPALAAAHAAAPALAAPAANGNGTAHAVTYAAAPDDAPSADPPSVEDDPADETQPHGAEEVRGDEGPIHRRLIRATLPRPEGQKVERQIPDFTIRGNGNFRGDRTKMRGPGVSGGNGSHGGRRFRGASGGGGRPAFGNGNRGPSAGGRGPSTGSGRGPSTGSGRGPSTGSGRGRKRGR